MQSHGGRAAWVAVAIPLAVILGTMAVPANGRGSPAPVGQEADPPAPQDIAFFTVAYEGDFWGPECGQRVNVVRTDTGEAALSDHAGGSPLWMIRSAPGLDVVVGGFWGAYSWPFPEASWGSIQVLQRSPDRWDQWDVARTVVGPQFYSGIDIMPDGNTLLVATAARTPLGALAAPFRIEKYLLSEMTAMTPSAGQSPTHRLGPAREVLELPDPVASIFVDPDGRRAHLLTRSTDSMGRLSVRTIAVATMTESEPSIDLPLSASSPSYPPLFMTTMASLSPDARHLVTTGGLRPEINVADLAERRSWSLTVQDAVAVTDVSFSHGPENAGLLALNLGLYPEASARPTPLPQLGRIQAMIGELHVDHIAELGRGPVSGPWWLGRPAAIEWTADGSGVLAGGESRHISGHTRVSLLDVDDGGRRVSTLRELELCKNEAGYLVDILTGNGYMPTPTTTPTPSVSPSPSLTASSTPTSSASPTRTATVTHTPTATRQPVPIYLPLTVREHCTPGTQRIDVALVIDASTTMRDDLTSAGRPKLSAAIDAARSFVATMPFVQDQAAVVVFNEKAAVIQGLTGRRSDVEAALMQIPRLVRLQTRIDLGIGEAHKELTSARRNPANRPVMILLTDGLANPEPASTAVLQAQAAKDDHITVFTIGLGRDAELNVLELRQMASRSEYFYRTPDGEDLLAIYRAIAVEIPCPAESFWGRR